VTSSSVGAKSWESNPCTPPFPCNREAEALGTDTLLRPFQQTTFCPTILGHSIGERWLRLLLVCCACLSAVAVSSRDQYGRPRCWRSARFGMSRSRSSRSIRAFTSRTRCRRALGPVRRGLGSRPSLSMR